MPARVRGFLLQPTYRLQRGRAVVHLAGRLESGESFLIRDDRLQPHFYIRQRDRELAEQLGARRLEACRRATLRDQEPVLRVLVPKPGDTPDLRERLHRAGVPTYEADVRFARRYLIDHGVRTALEIEGRGLASGEPGAVPGFDRTFHNPRLYPARWSLRPSVLSLDIETDPRARRLFSVALWGCGASEVLLWAPPDLPGAEVVPDGARCFPSEGALLKALVHRFAELDPDILTGWNLVDFDLRVLAEVASRCRVSLDLGRGLRPLRLRPQRGGRANLEAMIPGRVVLDGLELLRSSFVRMEEHSLDFVAREVLGEGKLMSGGDRGQEILQAFRKDRQHLVDYNLLDARLVLDILDRLGLVELAVERSLLTGLPLDRVSSSVAAFDFLYLTELGRRGLVAPSVGAPGGGDGPAALGGHVLEPVPGLYRNVLVFDFKSLYPSLIRTFGIDPLGYVPSPEPDEDLVVAPNGAAFRRQQGILPAMLDELFPRRAAAQRENNKIASQAIKILMNSFYGVLGTSACRFYEPALAAAITSFGRELLQWSQGQLEAWGHRVLYGDTDSLFVQLEGQRDDEAQQPPADEVMARGAELTARINRALEEHLKTTWGVESRLEMELEKLFLRLMLPPMRHSTAGARKRYAGLVEGRDGPKVEFTGMEVVRRDWTDLARQLQRELYQRLFFDQPVDEYLNRQVKQLRAGELDELLVYRKALRKSLGAYTSTSPPHVVAARKLKARRGDLIHYVITERGPEPVEQPHAPLDHEHYVSKQVQPVAEPVLQLLGLEFAKVIGDDRQLQLF
ncbi:MAG: DNA polymerase II [Acidobacteriota bacterium]|nr:DNA polymerase II [Acidobacteriota bacterium]